MQQPSSGRHDYDNIDAGAPLPDFASAGNIQMQTIAPAFGVVSQRPPDYLHVEEHYRGPLNRVFPNTGVSYLIGITSGGLYGLYTGQRQIPNMRMQLKFNAMLNFAGRYGSRFGNMLGVVSVVYSLYESLADGFDVDRFAGPLQPAAPVLAGGLTGMTYFCTSGPRVAVLAGAVGAGTVGVTYLTYGLLGWPYGRLGYLFL